MDLWRGGQLDPKKHLNYDADSPNQLVVLSDRELRMIAGGSAPIREDAIRILAEIQEGRPATEPHPSAVAGS